MTDPINFNDTDQLVLALTLYGEARGEGVAGLTAVAWVIRNRASRSRFTKLAGSAGAVAGVCRAPWQFSCWNAGDPNSARLRVWLSDPTVVPRNVGEAVWAVAGAALNDLSPDPTNGGDHYHTRTAPAWAGAWPPDWAATMPVSAQIGEHIFYDSRRGR